MAAELEYIGSGGFGRVFIGELRGAAVALKVLYKSDNDVVGRWHRCCYESILDVRIAGLLSRGVDVGLS